MEKDISQGEMLSDGGGRTPLPGAPPMGDDDEPARGSDAAFAALMEAWRGRWQEMEEEQRALLVYCLQQLRARVLAGSTGE